MKIWFYKKEDNSIDWISSEYISGIRGWSDVADVDIDRGISRHWDGRDFFIEDAPEGWDNPPAQDPEVA